MPAQALPPSPPSKRKPQAVAPEPGPPHTEAPPALDDGRPQAVLPGATPTHSGVPTAVAATPKCSVPNFPEGGAMEEYEENDWEEEQEMEDRIFVQQDEWQEDWKQTASTEQVLEGGFGALVLSAIL